MRRIEVALAAALVALNALILWEGWRVASRLAAEGNTDPLNGGRYVLILGAILAVASVAWIAGRLGQRGKPSTREPGVASPPGVATKSGRTMIAIASCIAYALLLPFAGFALANLALLTVLFLFLSRYGLARSLAGGAGGALCLHLLFSIWLGVPLPRLGWLGL